VAPPGIAERWRAQGIMLVAEDQEWDEMSLSNVDAALSQLPAAIRAQLGNPAFGPVTVLVNQYGRTLSGQQPYGGAANFFSTNEVRNELVLYPGQSPLTILHELGHAYNLRRVGAGRYALVLLDPQMQSFMAATGWSLLTPRDQIPVLRDHTQASYGYSGRAIWPNLSHHDPLEDFANSFALYFWSPVQLRALSPERHDWFAANLEH
jgi:hypothetical protein